ncbi:MAG: peptide ABC transporter substrate-binding protein [Candidatus Hydrogenedentota bacterium]
MRLHISSLSLLALVGTACSPPSQPSTLGITTLHISSGGEPKSLDPHLVTGTVEEKVLSSLFEGLVNMDYATMMPVPGAAERWDVSEDGVVYAFHINPTAKWSNGDPVTAGDFVYSWERILNPKLAAEYAYMLYPIAGAEAYNKGETADFGAVGAKASDDSTLVVTLRAPTPYFLALHIHFTFYPVHRATIEAHGGTYDREAAWTRAGIMVSNGPFMLSEWVPNDRIIANKNPDYWDAAKVRLDAVHYHPIQNPSVEERSFRAGELHITDKVPITKIQAYAKEHPDQLRVDPYLGTEFIRFNVKRPPLDDVRVRRALAMSIDRERIVNNIFRGGQRAAEYFTPPDTAGYTCETRVPYDPEQARALLAEAGYPGGKGFPVKELLYDSGDNQRLYVEAIQSMWRETLGIDVVLRNIDQKTWIGNMISGDFDIAKSAWYGDYVDPGNFLEMFFTNSGNNRTGFESAEFDSMVHDAGVTRAGAARDALFQRAEKILLDAAPIAPVYFQSRPFLLDPRVRNVYPNQLGRISFKDVYIVE